MPEYRVIQRRGGERPFQGRIHFAPWTQGFALGWQKRPYRPEYTRFDATHGIDLMMPEYRVIQRRGGERPFQGRFHFAPWTQGFALG